MLQKYRWCNFFLLQEIQEMESCPNIWDVFYNNCNETKKFTLHHFLFRSILTYYTEQLGVPGGVSQITIYFSTLGVKLELWPDLAMILLVKNRFEPRL